MLVKELAKSFGRHNIRVNALVPGAIAAGGFVADPKLAKHIPLGRLGEAKDLAPMALAVLSNKVSGLCHGRRLRRRWRARADQLVRSAGVFRTVTAITDPEQRHRHRRAHHRLAVGLDDGLRRRLKDAAADRLAAAPGGGGTAAACSGRADSCARWRRRGRRARRKLPLVAAASARARGPPAQARWHGLLACLDCFDAAP